MDNLLEEGSEVWVLDNLFTGKHPDKWLAGFSKKEENNFSIYEQGGKKLVFIYQDAIDFFRNIIAGKSAAVLPNFDEAYHLAAVVGGRAVLIENDPLMVATNHIIDSLFFQWAVKAKPKAVLYVSTSVAYPFSMQDRGKHVAMREEYLSTKGHGQIGLPESIYGWIKLAGEYLATVAHEKYGLSVVCVRPFSGYGEDQELDYPIPSIAARAARRENPLIVWGSGDQGRDFIHIDDFVSALRIAIQKVHDASAVNIGMGGLLTFKEIAKMMAEIEGYSPEIKGLSDKPEGSFAVYNDPTFLKSLGWEPKNTVRQGFERVLKSVKERIKNES